MNTKELLKKYWFVGVVALLLIGFIGLYSVESIKKRPVKVAGKQVDGKDVAYTINGEAVFADDLYDSLFTQSGAAQTFAAYQRAIFNAAYETTDDIKNYAANQAAIVMQQNSQSYLDQVLKSMGYSGVDQLTDYFIDARKQEMLLTEFVKADPDKYITPALGENGRLIYHILIKCDTTEVLDAEGNVTAYEAAPTEEQTVKLNEVLGKLTGDAAVFQATAYQYSEDTGSVEKGGYIGIINEENKGNYDPMFAQAAMSLKEGETSEPIVSSYGYHIILNAGMTTDKLLEDLYFLNELQSTNSNLNVQAAVTKGEELGFEIKSQELLDMVNASLESEE